MFGMEKPEWWFYQTVKKFQNMSTRFDIMHNVTYGCPDTI